MAEDTGRLMAKICEVACTLINARKSNEESAEELLQDRAKLLQVVQMKQIGRDLRVSFNECRSVSSKKERRGR